MSSQNENIPTNDLVAFFDFKELAFSMHRIKLVMERGQLIYRCTTS